MGLTVPAKRLVTPDILHIGNFGGRELLEFHHNPAFSDITQYEHPLAAFRANVEERQKEGELTPHFVLAGHQHILHFAYEDPTWVGMVPGLLDPELAVKGRLRLANLRVLMDKMHRRSTFAKELVRPAILEIEAFKEGRYMFRFWNPKSLAITEANQAAIRSGQKEDFYYLVFDLSDVQNGSITHQPEIVVKALDYFLYLAQKISQERGIRVKIILVIGGDFNHGNVYAAHSSENHLTKLSTIRSQKDFGYNQLYPIIIDKNFLHYLVMWKILTGNHEWDPPIVQARGQNDLEYLHIGFAKQLGRMFENGELDHPISVDLIGRWRHMATTKNGEIVNWPFCDVYVEGFLLAFMHKFYLKSGKADDPTVIMKTWTRRHAHAARNIFAEFQHHLHHREFRMHANNLYNQMAAFAEISGFEYGQGFKSTVMATIIHISPEGYAQEELTREFLRSWKCKVGPYRPLDEHGFLDIPAQGTPEYRSGKRSEYFEWLCDFIHQYPEQLGEGPRVFTPYRTNPIEQFLIEKGLHV